jgi:TfoX/Sxy family transcriptional regulator of competence genes
MEDRISSWNAVSQEGNSAMPYDQSLAARVRNALHHRRGIEEKQMFGGLAFMVRGHMCCGVLKDDLVLRVGPDVHRKALTRPDARPMNFTGRSMRGFIYVNQQGVSTSQRLQSWLKTALSYNDSLPPKKRTMDGARHRSRNQRRGILK